MVRLVAFGAAIALVGAAGVVAYAAVLRYRGRTVPRAVLRLAAGLLGAGHGLGFLYMPDLAFVGLFLVIPAAAIFVLVRRGHGVAAGILLIALGLTGAVWWGFYLLQDAFDPVISYEAILWLWWAPEVLLIVAGTWLLLRGDRTVAAPALFPRAATHARDPAPIGSAILRATLIGPIPIQVLVGVGAAMLVVSFGLPWAVEAGLPWLVGLLAGAVIFAVIGVELGYSAIPRRLRRAWEGYAVVGNPEMKRFVASTGTRVPATLPAMRRWLEQNPERPETRWARAEVLLVTGDLAESRAVIERMPITSDWDRFEQHAMRVYLDWVEGADPDFEALRAHAETVGDPGSAERLAARGDATVAIARDIAAAGGDWMAPLIALRDDAGPVADHLLREDLRRATYRSFLLYGLLLSGFVLLASGLIG